MENRVARDDLEGWLSIYRRYARRGSVEWSATGTSFLRELADHAGLIAESGGKPAEGASDLAEALADTRLRGPGEHPARITRLFADLPPEESDRAALLRDAAKQLDPGGLLLIRADRGAAIEDWIAGEPALSCRGRHPIGRRCLFALQRRYERPRIALLPDSSGACMQIRTFAPLEELERRGEVQVTVLPGDASPEILVDHDLLLLQRFGGMPALRLMLEARDLGIPVALELDDDFFHLPWFNPGAKIYGRYEIQVALRALLRGADAIVTSTPYLRSRMLEYNDRVMTMHNLVDTTLFRREPGPFHDEAVTTFGYIGTRTHQEDFRPVIEPLSRLLLENDGVVRAVFVGHVPDELARLPHVRYLGWYGDYHNAAGALTRSGANIALAPLMDVEFNRSKSAMKYLEYGACGIPGIFSDVEAYHDFIRHGETGLLVREHTPKGWYEAMHRVVSEPDLRGRMADAAHNDVQTHHSIEQRAEDFLELYSQVLDGPAASPVQPLANSASDRRMFTVIVRADGDPLKELPLFGQLRDHLPEGSEWIVIARDTPLRDALSYGAEVEIIDGRQPGAELEAIARAGGEWILLVDGRVTVEDDTCERLLAVAGPSVGAIGPRMRNPSSEQSIAAVISGPDASDDALASLASSRPFSAARVLDPHCVLLNRQALTQVGGVTGGLVWEDALTDLCSRLSEANFEIRVSNLGALDMKRGEDVRDPGSRLASRTRLGTLFGERDVRPLDGLRRPSRVLGTTSAALHVGVWSRASSSYLEACLDRLQRHADMPFRLHVALAPGDDAGARCASVAGARLHTHDEVRSLADMLEAIADTEDGVGPVLLLHDGVMTTPGMVAEMVDRLLQVEPKVVVPLCNDGDKRQRLNVARGLGLEQIDLWIESRIADRHDEVPIVREWSPTCAAYDVSAGVRDVWRGRRGTEHAALASRAYAHVLSYGDALPAGLGPWPTGPFDLDVPTMESLTELAPERLTDMATFVQHLRPLLAALKRNPNSARVLAGVGLLHATRGDFQEGMSLLGRAGKIDPYDPAIRLASRRVRSLLDGAQSSAAVMAGAG